MYNNQGNNKNNQGEYEALYLFENPCNVNLFASNDESMNINKLKEANISELEVTEDLLDGYSIDNDQEYEFKGIMGKIGASYNNKFSKFKLFYASVGKGNRTEIIFRNLNCICKTKKLDKYFDAVLEYEHDACDILINEVCVIGKFIRTPNVVFKVTSIMYDDMYDVFNVNNAWEDEFEYALFANISGYIKMLVKNLQYDNENYVRIQEVVEGYKNHLKGLISQLKSKIDADEIMLYQRNYIEELFDEIFMNYYLLRDVSVKLRMILDDIIMMHTGLQTEEYDQLNVLYDVRCLVAMTDISVIIRTLTCVKGVVLNMKDVVLIMLVYIRNFYNEYIDKKELDNETRKAYNVYDNKVSELMEGLGFDKKKTSYVGDQIKVYVRMLKNNI